MDFGEIEIEISEYLAIKILETDVVFAPIPEEETEVRPGYGKRNAFVAFALEDADADTNMGPVEQNTDITFSVLLQGKLLRGATGLYKLAEQVKDVLNGYRPANCRELIYSSHKFVRNDNKIFEYIVNFKTQGTRVQDITEDTTGPEFKDATYIYSPEN
jgi:hypothetical protein